MEPLDHIDFTTIRAVRSFVAKLADCYDTAGIFLYGSRARGTHAPDSDADVAVLLNGQPGAYLDTKLGMADMAFEVLLETGVRISPLPVWTEEWNHPETYTNPTLLWNIAREGLQI